MKSSNAKQSYDLSQDMLDIASKMHDHKLLSMEQANLLKTGELDIDLLASAQLQVEQEIKDNPVVSVNATGMTRNFVSRRSEPVFLVRSDTGKILGHYFASAFKKLS